MIAADLLAAASEENDGKGRAIAQTTSKFS
jgi:hypothetical protein